MKRDLVVLLLLLAAFFSSAGCSSSWVPDDQGGLDVRCLVLRTGRNAFGHPVMTLRCYPEKDMPQTGQSGA